jgi:hypothetical protein
MPTASRRRVASCGIARGSGDNSTRSRACCRSSSPNWRCFYCWFCFPISNSFRCSGGRDDDRFQTPVVNFKGVAHVQTQSPHQSAFRSHPVGSNIGFRPVRRSRDQVQQWRERRPPGGRGRQEDAGGARRQDGGQDEDQRLLGRLSRWRPAGHAGAACWHPGDGVHLELPAGGYCQGTWYVRSAVPVRQRRASRRRVLDGSTSA